MKVASESHPFVETNVTLIVEPVSSAIKTSFGSPAAPDPIITSVDKNLQEADRIRSDLKQIHKERVTILLRDEHSIWLS